MIKTKEIDKYIHNVLLKKNNEKLTEEDLLKVKELVLSGVNLDNEKIVCDFEDFTKLVSLESCILEQFDITDEFVLNLNSLKNLTDLTFSHCNFLSNKKIECEIKRLIIAYTKLNGFDILKNFEIVDTLMLIEANDVDLNELIQFKNIKKLCIYNSKVINMERINEFAKLKTLKLDGSEIDNEDILLKISKDIIVQREDKYLLES